MDMRKIITLVLCALLFSFCSEEKKLLRKASTAVDQSNFDKAIVYYDLIIHKDENSYFGNAGKGIVLSEFMGRHEQAIPYLEKAIQNSPPEKSKPVVQGNLAKSYHFIGNFKRALEYYGTIENNPDFGDYDEFLTKRIADCKYALAHPEMALAENQAVDNLGTTVNSENPEYTPVYSGNKLYFTSKRQDDPSEKKNGIDGKYFESVYEAERSGNGWSNPKKVQLGETPGMGKKYGEAIASASPDGKTLYIYKGGKIFSTQVDDPGHKMTEMDKSVNFASLQNHVAVSPDGNTMYITSESDKGRGGSDIYYCEKRTDGTWGDPIPMGHGINTPFDEEAPYVNENGVLFFSSNGHPGYGGFDIYRTSKVNGQWTTPVNLGQPLNSPGDDIFFALLPNSSRGYFASARPGGHGDLDIYKVHYVITDLSDCKPASDVLAINAMPQQNNTMAYNISLTVPEDQKSSIRSYAWSVNGKPLAETTESFRHQFEKPDTYVVTAKVVTGCDSCPQLLALCSEKTIEVKNEILASTENDEKLKNKGAFPKNQSGRNKKGAKNPAAERNESFADSDPGKDKTGKSDNEAANKNTASASHALTADELKSMNWDGGSMLFGLNESEITGETRVVLEKNAAVLKGNDGLKVVITGHADSRGSEALNKNLSLKRAKAVKDFFVSQGVSGKQIKSVQGKGEQELVNNCSDGVECDESQHAQNRRVQIEVIGTVKNPGSITQN